MSQPPPEGFILQHEFITEQEELNLLQAIGSVEFGEFRMKGVVARRRVAHFGWSYSFEQYRVSEAPAIPEPFLLLREQTAALAGIEPVEFAEMLITEYRTGAGIGWHRDAPPFGLVAGISLAGECRMRLQRGQGAERETTAVMLPPRSAYLLTGLARTMWQHMIPPTKVLRYSVTFRTMRKRR